MEYAVPQYNQFEAIVLDNNVMHTKPDLRVVLKWMIAGSGPVNPAVELNRIAIG